MLEQEITKLTAAVTQLTVATEALIESLRTPSVTTVAVDSRETAEKVMDRIKAEVLKTEAPVEEPAAAPKPKKAKAPKAEEPAPAPVAEAAPAPEPVADKPVVTLEQLRSAAQQALDSGRAKEIVAINKEYGLKRISDANPDQYAAILKRLEEINGQA